MLQRIKNKTKFKMISKTDFFPKKLAFFSSSYPFSPLDTDNCFSSISWQPHYWAQNVSKSKVFKKITFSKRLLILRPMKLLIFFKIYLKGRERQERGMRVMCLLFVYSLRLQHLVSGQAEASSQKLPGLPRGWQKPKHRAIIPDPRRRSRKLDSRHTAARPRTRHPNMDVDDLRGGFICCTGTLTLKYQDKYPNTNSNYF